MALTTIVQNLPTKHQFSKGEKEKTILFLHGRGRSLADRENYFPVCKKNNYSYFALDFPGF